MSSDRHYVYNADLYAALSMDPQPLTKSQLGQNLREYIARNQLEVFTDDFHAIRIRPPLSQITGLPTNIQYVLRYQGTDANTWSDFVRRVHRRCRISKQTDYKPTAAGPASPAACR